MITIYFNYSLFHFIISNIRFQMNESKKDHIKLIHNTLSIRYPGLGLRYMRSSHSRMEYG